MLSKNAINLYFSQTPFIIITFHGDFFTPIISHFLFHESSPIEAPIQAPPPPTILTEDELKKIDAYKAVEFVESGMVLGLGTGSIVKHADYRIAELLHQGKLTNIIGIPTSKKTQEQAISLGIPLSDLDKHLILDLAIDGADEVDPYLNLVKRCGGSLLREKMVESAFKKFIVIVDQTKLVKNLGGTGGAVPIEVVPFCWKLLKPGYIDCLKKNLKLDVSRNFVFVERMENHLLLTI